MAESNYSAMEAFASTRPLVSDAKRDRKPQIRPHRSRNVYNPVDKAVDTRWIDGDNRNQRGTRFAILFYVDRFEALVVTARYGRI